MASEGEEVFVSGFSHKTSSFVGAPTGPRQVKHRNLFAEAADEVRRSCAVIKCSPVNETHRTPPHHELHSYSAATASKTVSLVVRGAAAEVGRDEFSTVPHIPNGCFLADALTSQRLKIGVPGVSPGGAFAYFSRRGEK